MEEFHKETLRRFMEEQMHKMFEDSFVNQILNEERLGDTDYSYLDMFCCGKEMNYVFQNKKIIMAFCQICKREWRPNSSSNPEIKTHYAGVDFGKEGDKVGFRTVQVFSIDLEKENDNVEHSLSRDLSIRPVKSPSSES